jgi:peptide/nickel transport system permease protein
VAVRRRLRPKRKSEVVSQRQLVWRRFKRHRIGTFGGVIVLILALMTIFAGPIAPYHYATQQKGYAFAPPTRIHSFGPDGFSLRPFVYGIKRTRDPETTQRIYLEDKSRRYPIRLFVRGDEYRFLGLFRTNVHLFGIGEPPDSPGQIFLFGTDKFGRDIFSRTLMGGRISLSIGPLSIIISLFVGVILGGISGYYGGGIDIFIQRLIEVVQSFPGLPIWLALAAALPKGWSPTMVFFGLIIIFSLFGWTGLARVLRGMFLSLREEEFALAAKAMGASDLRIILRHLLPNTTSYLIVSATLTIPAMIIAETSISFLGLGIRDPMTSWGLLLNQANSIPNLRYFPWLLIPGIFIVVAVLAFNFLGDALRDAYDPYSVRGMR